MQPPHIWITGAGRGIGAAIAHAFAMAFASEGVKLTLAGRNKHNLLAQADRLRQQFPKLQTHVAAVDITDAQAVLTAMHDSTETLGGLNVLVNNAGQALSQPFARTDMAMWQQMLSVNLTGTYVCIQAALPSLLVQAQSGGLARIVNVASTAGLKGYPYVTAYAAAKHGVIGLTKSLALELAKKGVTVNAVCPGFTQTDIVADSVANIMAKTGQTQAQAHAALTAHNPQQRMVLPAEVAQTVLWLCQPSSASVNGQAIAVDGGELAG